MKILNYRVLNALSQDDRTTEELVKLLEDVDHNDSNVRDTMKRLTAKGYVEVVGNHKPDAGVPGRPMNVYGLTASGKDHLQEILTWLN